MRFFLFIYLETTDIYTLSLHDALPICPVLQNEYRLAKRKQARRERNLLRNNQPELIETMSSGWLFLSKLRSEEHTSELQSRQYLVCRLLLEKKKKKIKNNKKNTYE